MGICSYEMVGAADAMEKNIGSGCHGAGRVISRHVTKAKPSGKELLKEIAGGSIIVKAVVVLE